MKKLGLQSVRLLIAMTLLTGVLYVVAVTAFGQLLFPYRANGSLVEIGGGLKGSELIGQEFDSSIYFWSRPSATGYNPIPSGASNYGPTSDTLKKLAVSRSEFFSVSNFQPHAAKVPTEMIFASGSGLDPHISPEAAYMQAARIVKARHFSQAEAERLNKLIEKLAVGRQFHLLGEPRINVFLLNLYLDKLK
jgi:potassium-transporting ATPase KdpC subunit